MKVGVLGTGIVGRTLAGKLVSLAHQVTMGSRQRGNEMAVAWASAAGESAGEGSFADAAHAGELVVNATAGAASLDALALAGADNLAGKVLIDVANPLDFSAGIAALADRLQHRQPRRADPARVPGRTGGEGAEHGQRRRDGRPAHRAGLAHDLHRRQ